MSGVGAASAGAPDAPGGSSSDERTRDALLIGLTFAAGVVDAISYLGLGHIFTANMTGNVVFLALAVGQRSLLTALYSVGALIGFAVGAIAAGQLLLRPRPAGVWPRRVTLVLWAQLVFLVAFAAVWAAVGGNPGGGGLIYVLIGLASVRMGMQNAAARHLAVPGLTTTVVTTALTGLMVDLPALGISGPVSRRAFWAVLALFSGAALGAALLLSRPSFAPLLAVATVAAVAVNGSLVFGDSRESRPRPGVP